MQAKQQQTYEQALEIAVSDAGRGEELDSDAEATVCLLPRRPGALFELALAPEIDPAEQLSWEDYEGTGLLPEPSEELEFEAARSAAGLARDEAEQEREQVESSDDPLAHDDDPLAHGEDIDEQFAACELMLRAELDCMPDPAPVPAEPVFEPAPLIDIGAIGFSQPKPEPVVEPELELELELSIEAELDSEAETDSPITASEPEAVADALAPAVYVEAEDATPDPIRAPLWSGLNTGVYAFVRGLRGMGQSPLVQLLALGTMAVCMLLLGTTMLIFANAQRVARDLGVDTPVTVYMVPGADPVAAVALRDRVAGLPEVARAQLVSPDQALAQLRDGAGDSGEPAELLAGIDASVLPYSLEIALTPGVEPGFADALAGRVQSMDGVDEVAVLGPWVQEVERMLTTLRWLALGVAALVSLACLAIVWSTIRLGVFARRAELQILRLVGGTGSFVRGPFLVEGVLQGVLGTALALAVLWLAFDLIRPFLERGMSLMFAAGSLQFFSIVQMLLALGFGALLGLIGSRAAVARHAEA